MPNIPGMPISAGVPLLGQGVRGGAAGLQGLPGAAGASNIPGLPPLSALPHVQIPLAAASPIPSPALLHPNTALDQAATDHTKERLNSAMQILMHVRAGQMEPKKAAKLLDDLTPDERKTLTKTVLDHHAATGGPSPQAELQALRYLPVDANAHTSTMTPRPAGIGTNLLRDAVGAVTGMPAGIALAGKAAVHDFTHAKSLLAIGKAATGDPSKLLSDTQLGSDIATPIGKSYEHTYGPLAHLDFGEFGKRVEEHPLGPILDVASLVSGGLGVAGRVADASAALRAGVVTRDAAGIAKVGDRFTVQPLKNGTFGVREGNNYVAHNLPDEASAIKHAQSLQPFESSPTKAFIKGGGDRGRLVDRYDSAKGYSHELETTNMMKEIADVLDKPNLRLSRRSFGEVLTEVKNDLKATRAEGKARSTQIAADNPAFFGARPVRKGLAVGETALREASDLVRAGAIYLRPAYLPNNWVGNTFMNTVHQGVLAPVNLAKSLVVDKHIGGRYTAAMDKAMGQNAAEVVTTGKGRGYVGSITNPMAHSMGMLADQPFRRAAFLHEARRAGYSKLSDVQKLFDTAAQHGTSAEGQTALKDVATIGRKAQEEIVKFGHMNDAEQSVIRNLIFVYSWVRGAARYAGRFPLQHPIQSNVFHHLSQDVGNPYLAKEMGGVPNYLAGAIPVGHDKNGNPILINPFSLNPLGTAVDVGRAVAGTLKVIRHPKDFNKYVDSDIASVLNPLAQSYLSAREGGKPPIQQLEQTIAPVRLAHDLVHPGSGSVFPMSRTEALGHFTVGAMFPRVADQAALTRSLERQQANDPIARIPADISAYKKMTGADMPSDLVGAYKGDLEQVQMMKDFQIKYASDHGQSGFRNLPPANKVDAAIKFIEQHKLASKEDIASYKSTIPELTNDADMNSFANTLFSSTGIGQYKAQWDSLMRDARGLRVTRKKP